MRKFLISLLIVNCLILPTFAQQEIKFSNIKRSPLLIERNETLVYKPTKLNIGEENKFIIKAAPGSNVSLALSDTNTGAPLFYGKQLRLGPDIDTIEGIIPDNGVLEISIPILKDKNLEGKSKYFEVAIWKNKDFSDIKLAKIMSPSGRETDSNEVKISLPIENAAIPTFSPILPGVPQEFYQTMDTIQKIKSGEFQNPEKKFEDK